MAMGDLARSVRDLRILLEICITSDLHTKIAETAAEHPVGMLRRAGFVITLNTDDRLMGRPPRAESSRSLTPRSSSPLPSSARSPS